MDVVILVFISASDRKVSGSQSEGNHIFEALESGMCDVIKIRLNRRDGRRSGKGNA